MKPKKPHPHIISEALACHLVQREKFKLIVAAQLSLFEIKPPDKVFTCFMGSKTVVCTVLVNGNSQDINTVIHRVIRLVTGKLDTEAQVIHSL